MLHYFANIDSLHIYWKLALKLMSQECQSIITPKNIFMPTDVLHGMTSAVVHLQSSLAGVTPDHLRLNVLCRSVDVLLHPPTENGLLQTINSFFELCVEHNLNMNHKKCTRFATSIRLYGHFMSADGIRYNRRLIEGLLSKEPLPNEAQLREFVCSIQWV